MADEINKNGFEPVVDPQTDVGGSAFDFSIDTSSGAEQPQGLPVVENTSANNSVAFEDSNDAFAFSAGGEGYDNPNWNKPPATAGMGGLAIVYLIFKTIICAIFPIFGFVMVGVSRARGHRLNAKIYTIVATISIILQMIIGGVLGTYVAKKVPSGDINYDISQQIDDLENNPVDENTTTDEPNVIDSSWTSISVNGQSFELPCKFSEFSNNTGLVLNSDVKNGTLDSGDYSASMEMDSASGEYAGVYVTLENPTEQDNVPYENCVVSYLNIYSGYESIVKDASVGGLKLNANSNRAALEELFGATTYDYKSDDGDYESYEWETQSGESSITLRVDLANGAVSSIGISIY